MSRMTVDQMRYKLQQWNPTWNLDNKPSRQIAAMYHSQSTKRARQICDFYNGKAEKLPEQMNLF